MERVEKYKYERVKGGMNFGQVLEQASKQASKQGKKAVTRKQNIQALPFPRTGEAWTEKMYVIRFNFLKHLKGPIKKFFQLFVDNYKHLIFYRYNLRLRGA